MKIEIDEMVRLVDQAILEKKRLKYPVGTTVFYPAISKGIKYRIFYGAKEFIDNSPIAFLNEISRSTAIVTNDYAAKNGLINYSFVNITRSSVSGLQPGTYLYSFDENLNLKLLAVPYELRAEDDFKSYAMVYDVKYEKKPILINNNYIKDFQYFGTQLMEVNVSSTNSQPKIIDTLFSELVLGTSYTLLKGLNKFSISTENKVKDYRVVQVILNDKTDIEFSGISIFYEFNRLFGNAKNKEVVTSQVVEEIVNNKSNDYISELKDLKNLYDMGIITEEEFNIKKKSLLNT